LTMLRERDIKVSQILEKIADKKGTLITSIALAYVMHKAPYVFPVVGGRKVDHLKGNIEALSLELTRAELEEIESAVEFDQGFPMNFIGIGQNVTGAKDVKFSAIGGVFDYVEGVMVNPFAYRTTVPC